MTTLWGPRDVVAVTQMAQVKPGSGRVYAPQQRFKKTYRHPTLDGKLTKSRLNMEARSIVRARKLGVVTPSLYYVDTVQSAIYMEHVEAGGLLRPVESPPPRPRVCMSAHTRTQGKPFSELGQALVLNDPPARGAR